MRKDKMSAWRIEKHPILAIPKKKRIYFYWNSEKLEANEGEVISSALFANGIRVFGRHAKDGSPLGIFCANGQCAQCTVLANGLPVKSCMTKVEENMIVERVEGLPELPRALDEVHFSDIEEFKTDVLIIGGGPAGLSAALRLGEREIETLVVDDKDRLGGKLVLQTHKFFGSMDDCYAGTRGIDIAGILEHELQNHPSVDVWLNSTVLYVFSDNRVGILANGKEYRLVKPEIVLNAAGAREKSLIFPGNALPGVYGAGAFQTLANRDLVKPASRLFVVGGGNVGLIAAYHALQAGITVVGLIEALPQVGGYEVHANKIKRLGVPIYTGHTIVSANGERHVESVTVSQVDDRFMPVVGTEKTFACDTVLIAVGLNPVNEFFLEAEQAGMKVFAAGDAADIAEASVAMFSGRIAGIKIANAFGKGKAGIPGAWYEKAELLKSHPGPVSEPQYENAPESGVRPVIHCHQKIPCNPCVSVCKQGVIQIPDGSLLEKPKLADQACIGCNQCLFICPGLAISLVDYRKDQDHPIVSLAYEVYNHRYKKGDTVVLTDYQGNGLQRAVVVGTVMGKASRKTQLIKVQVPRELAQRVAGFRIQKEEDTLPRHETLNGRLPDDATVCFCERVTAGEIRKLIRKGIKDLNQIKAITRAGMGACGAKTCETLMLQLFGEEGVRLEEVTLNTRRPLFVETRLGVFAGISGEKLLRE